MKLIKWYYETKDCPDGMFVLFSGNSEFAMRKRVVQRRREGIECQGCSEERGELVKHYDLRITKSGKCKR